MPHPSLDPLPCPPVVPSSLADAEAGTNYPVAGRPSPLLLKYLLDRPLAWAPDQQIIYRDLKILTYRSFFERVRRLANVLTRLGIERGDRVGVLDYDSHRYLELYFAVPMIGAVLHTVNVRLAPDQVCFTIAHAEDKVLFIHTDFVPFVEERNSRLPVVQQRVLLCDETVPGEPKPGFAGEYESLLDSSPAEFSFPDFEESTVATLFYTTGTTGDPKGVFFTHRQIVLHTFVVGFTLATGRQPVDLSTDDVYLPLTPMFHAHAWGVPYIATALGLKQIYPGRFEPNTLANLITKHQPTLSHGVPTILRTLLQHPAFRNVNFSQLKMLIGGSAVTEDLGRAARARGIRLVSGYGMSETCPVVAFGQVKPSLSKLDPEAQADLVCRATLLTPLVRAAIVDGQGRTLPPGQEHPGELVLQGPWLTQGYYKDPELSQQLWRDGWLHTGDVATFDPEGYLRITDRIKDVIKIGGEWISSLELENALNQHPAVGEAAVIGVPDPKWGERPHAQVVLLDGPRSKVTSRDLVTHLHQCVDRGSIHKRAILTSIQIVESLPRTTVGKLDKKALRAQLLNASAKPVPPAPVD